MRLGFSRSANRTRKATMLCKDEPQSPQQRFCCEKTLHQQLHVRVRESGLSELSDLSRGLHIGRTVSRSPAPGLALSLKDCRGFAYVFCRECLSITRHHYSILPFYCPRQPTG